MGLRRPPTGHLQIALIQPTAPVGPVPQLHHAAVRRDDAAAEATELPVGFESKGVGIHCIFLDARQQLGHVFERVTGTPEGRELAGSPKEAAV